MDKFRSNPYINIIILSACAAVLFKLPYFQDIMRERLIVGLGISNSQFGIMNSVCAISMILTSVPSALLANRYPSRWLIAISMFLGGVISFWYAILPSYALLLVLYFFIGVIITLPFWCALISSIAFLFPNDRSVLNFGAYEFFSGFFKTLISSTILYIVTHTVTAVSSISSVMLFFGITFFALGFIAFEFLPKNTSPQKHTYDSQTAITELRFSINFIDNNLSKLIIAATVIGLWYICWSMVTYIIPAYGSHYNMTFLSTNYLSLGANSVLMMISGPLCSYLCYKYSSPSRFLLLLALGFMAVTIVFMATPVLKIKALGIVFILLFCFCIVSARTCYWSLVLELGFDRQTFTLAVGTISMLAYSSDLYMPYLMNKLIGNSTVSSSNYQTIFVICLIIAILLIVTSILSIYKSNYNKPLQHKSNDT